MSVVPAIKEIVIIVGLFDHDDFKRLGRSALSEKIVIGYKTCGVSLKIGH